VVRGGWESSPQDVEHTTSQGYKNVSSAFPPPEFFITINLLSPFVLLSLWYRITIAMPAIPYLSML
jgi:hypothetical protein